MRAEVYGCSGISEVTINIFTTLPLVMVIRLRERGGTIPIVILRVM